MMINLFSFMLCMSLIVHVVNVDAIAETLKINSIGDWGDKDSVKFKTTQWAAETGTDGVILIGDNFYPKGVKNTKDKLFKNIFEKGFRSTEVGKSRTFWAVAGNHDHYGKVDAQIQYGITNTYWKFPSLYYTQSFKSENEKLNVFVVFTDSWGLNGGDTLMHFNARTGETSIRSKELLDQMVKSGEIAEDVAKELQEKFPFLPKNFKIRVEIDEVQYQWIDQQLGSDEAQNADWLLVVGHYPVYSCTKGEHGDTPLLITRLKPLLEKHNVDAYLSGHDHILQHIQENGIQYFGSGAGAQKHRPVDLTHAGYQFASSGVYGYMEHEFTKTSFKTTFHVNLEGVKKNTYTYEVTK